MRLSALIAVLPFFLVQSGASPIVKRVEPKLIATNSPQLASGSAGSGSGVQANGTVLASQGGNNNGSSSSSGSSGSSSSSSSGGSSSGGSSGSGSSSLSAADATVVKFAFAAEALENTFYQQALQTFSADSFTQFGFVNGQAVFEQLQVIQVDEQTHFDTLKSVATSGGIDLSFADTCQFDFSSAMGSVGAFIQTARIFEAVGIGAYEGGALLVQNQAVLISALSIHAVEARHSAMLNLLGTSTPIAAAFDVPLQPQQVLSLLGSFVSGCDLAGALGITPTTALSITNTETIVEQTTLTFESTALQNVDTSGMLCNLIFGGNTTAIAMPMSQCKVPAGIQGVVFASITNSATALAVNIVEQDEKIIVAGPAAFIVEEQKSILAETIVTSNVNGGIGLTSSQSSSQDCNNSNGNGNSGSGSSSGSSGSSSSGTAVIITTTTVEQIRQESGIKKAVQGGSGGAIALGWM